MRNLKRESKLLEDKIIIVNEQAKGKQGFYDTIYEFANAHNLETCFALNEWKPGLCCAQNYHKCNESKSLQQAARFNGAAMSFRSVIISNLPIVCWQTLAQSKT